MSPSPEYGKPALKPDLSYWLSAVTVGLIAYARYAFFSYLGDRFPYSFFLIIIIFTGWFGPASAALLAIVLTFLSVALILPHFGVFIGPSITPGLHFSFFILASLMVTALSQLRQLLDKSRRIEAALRASEKKTVEFLDQANVNLKRLEMIEGAVNAGTWEFEIESKISHWPPGISVLWGLPARTHHIPLDDFLSRIYSEDRARVSDLVANAVAKGEAYEAEFRVVWPDQSVHWLYARGAPQRNRDAKMEKIIGIAIEVTQRRAAEDALRQSEKLAATGRMAATIAHEINNPLEAIVNLIYLAKMDAEISPQTRELLENADSELARVGHLVRQTLAFYRESSVPVAVDVAQTANEVLEVYESRLTRKNIKVTKDLSRLDEITGVEGEIRQVISNLLANAIDAVPMGGEIKLRVRQVRDLNRRRVVRITMADNGSGIAVTDRSKLFQPFFTTKKDVGTGLGLWVSKEIVQKYGGSIRAHSRTRPGSSGTVFRVDFPVPLQEESESIVAPVGSVRRL